MGWWRISADTLAGSRFVLSPLAETAAALRLLHTARAAHPGERAWLGTHLPAYRALSAADPVTALLVPSAFGTVWIADFLTVTPRGGESFEEEVERVRAVPAAAARAQLRRAVGGPLPALLDRDDLADRAAGVLTHVWEDAVRPYWGRRRRVLEADVVARTAQVARGGWAAALDALRPGTRWLGGDRLQVNGHELPPREISGAELLFVPVTAQRTGWVSWEGTRRYALVYPCAGALAGDRGREPVPAALGALLGGARARVLMLLGSPMSTSQLVAVTGQGLGSVGRHLRVLREAGLVERAGRTGRSVLYVRTAAGEVLAEAGRGAGAGAPSAGARVGS